MQNNPLKCQIFRHLSSCSTIVTSFSACTMVSKQQLVWACLQLITFHKVSLEKRMGSKYSQPHGPMEPTNACQSRSERNNAMFLSSLKSSIMANQEQSCLRASKKTKAATQNCCIGQDLLPRETSNI